MSGLLADLAYVRQGRSRCLWCCPGVAVVALGRPPCRARSGHDLLIRRLRQVVLDSLLQSVRWADIPQSSMPGSCCPPSWKQYWQQSRRNGTDPRPSARPPMFPRPSVKHVLGQIRQESGGTRQAWTQRVLRRVMRDDRPPADVRQPKARIAADARLARLSRCARLARR